MADTIATYRAEGWTESTASLDYGRILHHAEQAGLLPIRTETEALRAAEAAYGWGGNGGPWRGQIRVRHLSNWRWFTSWESTPTERP
jgi:hypothetical protein